MYLPTSRGSVCAQSHILRGTDSPGRCVCGPERRPGTGHGRAGAGQTAAGIAAWGGLRGAGKGVWGRVPGWGGGTRPAGSLPTSWAPKSRPVDLKCAPQSVTEKQPPGVSRLSPSSFTAQRSSAGYPCPPAWLPSRIEGQTWGTHPATSGGVCTGQLGKLHSGL